MIIILNLNRDLYFKSDFNVTVIFLDPLYFCGMN